MPNWCENDLTLSGPAAAVRNCLVALAGPESPVDFDRVIPMPPSLSVEAGTLAELGHIAWHLPEHEARKRLEGYGMVRDVPYERLRDWLMARYPSAKAMGDTYAENLRLYGVATWYDWCIREWGTKWNASSVKFVEPLSEVGGAARAVLTFETAWSPPTPVISRLAVDWPEVQLELRWYERGMALQGVQQYAGGILVHGEETDYHGERGG